MKPPQRLQPSPPQSIYIIGAQSTGKTTLVNALEAHFRGLPAPPTVIHEVARTLLRQRGITGNCDSRQRGGGCFTVDDIRASPTRSLDLQRRILAGQARAEHEAAVKSTKSNWSQQQHHWLVSDRSALDPVAYAWQYVGPGAARSLMTAEWRGMRDRMAGSLIVLCEAGVDWLTDDGVRLMPMSREEWLRTHEVFCQVLKEARLSYVVLPRSVGSTEERMAFVLRRWRNHTPDR
ncbi:P-loop containing protein [Apiospora sp. TS-2023a]